MNQHRTSPGYSPRLRLLAGDLLRRAFGGSARSLMLGALAARKASREELAEVRKLLDEYERGAK